MLNQSSLQIMRPLGLRKVSSKLEGGGSLAAADHRAEDVGIFAVIISELKLSDVQRHVFGADFVECADYAAFEDRPEAFNRVGVDRADNVLMFAMVHRANRIFLFQSLVSAPIVHRQQANFVRHNFAHENLGGSGGNVFQNAGDHVALALHRSNDRSFASGEATTTAALFVPMSPLVLSANVGFINFNNAAEFCCWLNHRGADFVAHAMRCAVRAEAKLALDLKRANSLFAGRHQVHDLEPVAQRLVGVLKDRSGDDGEPIAHRTARSALRALPVPLARRQVIDGGIATTRAAHAFRPAARFQISLGRIVIAEWKARFKFAFRHLMNWLRTPRHV
jgi:hypothetical protein